MFKELILAIALGGLLGFGITGGYLAINKKNPSTSNITNNTISPTPSPISSLTSKLISSPVPTITSQISDKKLTIDSPADESVITSSQTTLKGSTIPGSQIIITTADKIYYTTAENSGNFSYDLNLNSGTNQIQVDAITPTDDTFTQKLLITYSTAKF